MVQEWLENVLGIFWYLALSQVLYGNEEIYPKPCVFFRAQEIVALWSVKKIFPESYDFAATQIGFDVCGSSWAKETVQYFDNPLFDRHQTL